MKLSLLVALLCLSGCSWFHRKLPPPPPTELIVTGVPAASVVLLDGAPFGEASESNDRTVVFAVSPGDHKVEIKTGDKIAYRETTYVAPGEKRVVAVLSGANLN